MLPNVQYTGQSLHKTTGKFDSALNRGGPHHIWETRRRRILIKMFWDPFYHTWFYYFSKQDNAHGWQGQIFTYICAVVHRKKGSHKWVSNSKPC